MKARSEILIQFAVLALAAIFPWSAARAQSGNLQSDLETKYKLVKMGNDSTGSTIIEPGKVLVIQKGGILGVPPGNMMFCPTHYQDGNMKGPSTVCKLAVAKVSHYLTTGEKVYVTKIEIIQKDEKVILSIMECDTCNNAQSASSMKSQVVFHFPKAYLETADAGQVEDMIGQVFTEDTAAAAGGDQQAQGQAQGGQDQQQAAPAADAAPAQPPPPPATVQMGQTPDQVTAALGQPDKILNIGAKTIYVYKDIKVTFINNKVTDAQ